MSVLCFDCGEPTSSPMNAYRMMGPYDDPYRGDTLVHRGGQGCHRNLSSGEVLDRVIPIGARVRVDDLDPKFYPSGSAKGVLVAYRDDRFVDIVFDGEEAACQYEPRELVVLSIPVAS